MATGSPTKRTRSGGIGSAHEPCTVRDRCEPIGDIVAACEYREHARRRERCCLVDRSNPRMGMGRAHDHRMRLLRQAEIVGKAALAGKETSILLPPHRLTNAVSDASRQVHARY